MMNNSTLIKELENPKGLEFLCNKFPIKDQNVQGAKPSNHHRNLAFPKIFPFPTLNSSSLINHLKEKLPK